MLQIVDRPGYFGHKRQRRCTFYDNLFGVGRWREMWEVDGRSVPFDHAVSLYDESYYLHLQAHPEVVEFITSFGECYDNDPSDIRCGCTHDEQSCPRHIQDISVRRALKRLGVWFYGPNDKLLNIRGPESNGFELNPGRIPFCQPELILTHHRAGTKPIWANDFSVEHFWQSNKVIVVETC